MVNGYRLCKCTACFFVMANPHKYCHTVFLHSSFSGNTLPHNLEFMAHPFGGCAFAFSIPWCSIAQINCSYFSFIFSGWLIIFFVPYFGISYSIDWISSTLTFDKSSGRLCIHFTKRKRKTTSTRSITTIDRKYFRLYTRPPPSYF